MIHEYNETLLTLIIVFVDVGIEIDVDVDVEWSSFCSGSPCQGNVAHEISWIFANICKWLQIVTHIQNAIYCVASMNKTLDWSGFLYRISICEVRILNFAVVVYFSFVTSALSFALILDFHLDSHILLYFHCFNCFHFTLSD